MHHRSKILVLTLGLALVIACKKSESSDGCTKDTDCRGNRVCQSGACVESEAANPAVAPPRGMPSNAPYKAPPGGEGFDEETEEPTQPRGAPAPVGAAPAPAPTGAAPSPAPEPAPPAPMGEPAPTAGAEPVAQGGDGAGCEPALTNAYAVVNASGNAALLKLVAEYPIEKEVPRCAAGWPASVIGCLRTAKTIEDIYHDCYLRPFKDKPLTIGRRFTINNLAGLQSANPKVGELHGDYVEISKGCGTLMQRSQGVGALFLTCNGKTRPLMMPDESAQVFAAFAQDETNRHNTVVSFINRTRVDLFGGWKVCDRNGNCRIQ